MNRSQMMLKSKIWLSVGILGLLIIAVIGYVLGWWAWLWGYASVWMWSALLLLAVGLLIWMQRFIPRYREKRFVARLRGGDGSQPVPEHERSHRQLHDKMLEAIRILNNAPEIRKAGGLPLYALPWYLLIGPPQSGKTALLHSVAHLFSPFARPSSTSDGPTQNCDWWFFNTAIVLDTASSYAFPTQAEQDAAQWYRFLQLLRHYRDLQPINGMVIAVAADMLASQEMEELRHAAAELRKRIDETIRELGIDFPVYLLITRCDLIEGFTEFFMRLPEPALNHVLGFMKELPTHAGDGQPFGFDAMFEAMLTRLYRLRLSLLLEKPAATTLQQKLFCFPEEFHALQKPLSTFVEALFAENPFQHTPFLRGIFFGSAQQQGTPLSSLRRELRIDGQGRPLERQTKSYFLHDLLAVILPRDRYLVRSTVKATASRRLKNLLGLSACLAVCLVVGFSLTRAWVSDRRLLASTDDRPCQTAAGEHSQTALLESVESCHQAVQRLIDQNHQRPAWSRLLFNRSGRLEQRLRQRYLEKFTAEVLRPLDAAIVQQLAANAETIPLVFLLIKRIELINQCLSTFGCSDPIEKGMQPDYQLFLEPAAQQPPTLARAAILQATYETYLHWAIASPEILRREQEAHAENLRRWFASKHFTPPQILSWANEHYAPVMLHTFWPDSPTTDGKKAVQVDGGYTAGAWKQSILPFLDRAGEAVPDTRPLLQAFKEEYRTQYFEQWRRFLAEFPQGEVPWWRTREQRRKLALKLLDESSPYNRILDVTFDELTPLLPSTMVAKVSLHRPTESTSSGKVVQIVLQGWHWVSQFWQRRQPSGVQDAASTGPQPTVPPWVAVLHDYLGSESRKAYLSALKDVRQQVGENTSREGSFQLAQAGFREERPSEKSTQPLFRAWGIMARFREQEGAKQAALDKSFWPLLERPVLLAWKITLEGAGEFLQQAWAQNVVAPTKGLSELEQADFLYGPQGKVREFVDRFAKPFLADNESRLGQVLGEEVPLGASFLKALRDERQLKPVLELGKRTPSSVRVEATRESVIDSQTNLLEDKTEFQVECQAKTFKVSDRPQEGIASATTVFWSFENCGEVIVAVFMTCDRRCVDRAAAVGISVPETSSLRLAKRYKGQGAFLHFLQDFSGGSHTYMLADFVASYAPGEWQQLAEALRRYRVSAVRVYYHTDVPSTLATLMSLLPNSKPPSAIVK